MKNYIALFLFFIVSLSFSQTMTTEKLNTIITSVSDTVKGENGRWRFLIKGTPMICLTDASHNRMRIIAPIIDVEKLTDEINTEALLANFHTALDVKYAISDNVMWAVFIHPLKELSDKQVTDAISQLYFARLNFGTSY